MPRNNGSVPLDNVVQPVPADASICVQPEVIERSRSFLIKRLREQQQLALSLLAGRTLFVPRPIWRQNALGRYARETIVIELHPLWFESTDGNLYFSIKYLGQIVQFESGRYAMPLGLLADIPDALEPIIQRIEQGQLDDHIAELWRRRKWLQRRM